MARRIEAKRSGWKTIRYQIEPQELHRYQSFGHAKQDSQEDAHNFANVRRDEVSDELLGVVVDCSTFLHSLFNRSEVVIDKNHVSSKLGYIGSRTHCDTNIGLFKSDSIVDAISCLLIIR